MKIIGDYLPKGSHGIINDLGIALSQTVPLNQYVSAGTLTIVGVITGLDGSGFSGISLAGSIANLFGTALGHGTATLTALGQIAAIWTGGGTLIPWALIPAAAICKVDPFELARRNFYRLLSVYLSPRSLRCFFYSVSKFSLAYVFYCEIQHLLLTFKRDYIHVSEVILREYFLKRLRETDYFHSKRGHNYE